MGSGSCLRIMNERASCFRSVIWARGAGAGGYRHAIQAFLPCQPRINVMYSNPLSLSLYNELV
jgi:hypothetical protein